MIEIFKKFIKSKSFIAFFILFLIVTFYTYSIICPIKIELYKNNILSLYSYLMPITFREKTEFYSIILGISYSIIISYILVQFLNYIFNTSSVSIMTRLGRKRVIKDIILINLLYSLIIYVIYILIFIYFYNKYHFVIPLSSNLVVILLIKLLLTILMPMLYLFIYINTDSPFLGTSILTLSSITIELILGKIFNASKLSFNYSILIICLLCIIILFLYKTIINLFERRDI